MKLSKAVRNGMVVTKRGDKYICCSGKKKPVGVYQHEHLCKIITGENFDQVKDVFTPTGIVIYGRADILVKRA